MRKCIHHSALLGRLASIQSIEIRNSITAIWQAGEALTDIGVSYNDKGFYVTSKLAYIQSFGLGEDADNFGLVLGAGKDWFIAEHWYAGGQLDLRWADTNASRRRDWAAAPSLYLGYSWEIASYQVQLGLPYFIGVQAKFPFKI